MNFNIDTTKLSKSFDELNIKMKTFAKNIKQQFQKSSEIMNALKYKTAAVKKGFEALIKVSVKLKNGFKSTFEFLLNGFTKVTGVITIATGIMSAAAGLLVYPFLNAAIAAEKYKIKLKALLGSQSEANKLFYQMTEFASGVPYEFDKIIASATNLSGFMRGGADEVNKWMPLITDLAAKTGLTIEEATDQISIMYKSGATSAELFEKKGINSMLGFEAGVKYSAEQTRKALIESYESPTSTFRGAAKELGNSWGGMMTILSNNWGKFLNKVMDTGIFDKLKANLKSFIDILTNKDKEGVINDWALSFAKGMQTGFNFIVKSVELALRGIASIIKAFYKVKGFINEWIGDDVDDYKEKIAELEKKKAQAEKDKKNNKSDFRGKSYSVSLNTTWDVLDDKKLQEAKKNLKELERSKKESSETILGIDDFNKNVKSISKKLSKSVNDLSTRKPKKTFNKISKKTNKGKVTEEAKQTEGYGTAVNELNSLYAENVLSNKMKGMSQSEQETAKHDAWIKQLKEKYQNFFQTDKEKEKFKDIIKNLDDVGKAALKTGSSFDSAKARSQMFTGQLKEGLDAMAGPLASAFDELSKTGKTSMKDLGAALIETLRMYAAQKTAHLLMEAAYHGIMGYIVGGEHYAKAVVALQGAAVMGSFVAGFAVNAGMAHDGITDIPKEGTWLLDKGERVVDSKTNQDLKGFLQGDKNSSSNTITINFHNSNESDVKKSLPALKKTILDVVNGDIVNNGQTLQTIKNYA
ncbi:MAG: hypothetical protein GY760_00890 [Deltaproteobacteria bacterium]|nr:hypothetical protein [Deltaproteobacteria bacterium]